MHLRSCINGSTSATRTICQGATAAAASDPIIS